jgi:hypothetical protein
MRSGFTRRRGDAELFKSGLSSSPRLRVKPVCGMRQSFEDRRQPLTPTLSRWERAIEQRKLLYI